MSQTYSKTWFPEFFLFWKFCKPQSSLLEMMNAKNDKNNVLNNPLNGNQQKLHKFYQNNVISVFFKLPNISLPERPEVSLHRCSARNLTIGAFREEKLSNGSYAVPIPIPSEGMPQGTPDFQMTPFLAQGGHLIGGTPNGSYPPCPPPWSTVYSNGPGMFQPIQDNSNNIMPGMAAEFVNNENGAPPQNNHQQQILSSSPPFGYQNIMNLTSNFGGMTIGPQIQQREPMYQHAVLHG